MVPPESSGVTAEAPLVTLQAPERFERDLSPCTLGPCHPGAVVMSPGGPPSPPTTDNVRGRDGAMIKRGDLRAKKDT